MWFIQLCVLVCIRQLVFYEYIYVLVLAFVFSSKLNYVDDDSICLP